VNWSKLINPTTLALLVPTVIILYWIVRSVMKHRERMAMIAKGLNPDALKPDSQD